MSKLKWILIVIASVIAAVIGRETYYQRQLRKERDRARKAKREALEARNAAAFAEARATVERIDRELAAARAAGVRERVAAARRAAAEARAGR